jgi:Flp pilus assembly protein TadG
MKGITMTRRTASRTRANDGQIIVIFALGLMAMIAMVGLVLDGGSTFAQRRGQQNAADLAALAGANEYLINGIKTEAERVARDVAEANGYPNDPATGRIVDVSFAQNDTRVVVDVSAPHRNNFTGVVGMTEWQVSTTARVEVGIPDTANGAPFIFNKDVFSDPGGAPLPQYSDPNNPFTFGDGNGDVPNDPNDIAWTCYGTCANVDSAMVRAMVDGTSPVTTTLDPSVDFTDYVGQANNGNHSTLFGDVDDLLSDTNVPVPIVDDNGLFQGWAMFHVTSANQGAKTITGYFVSPFNGVGFDGVSSSPLLVTGCTGSCPKPRYLGVYVLRLEN